MINLSLEMSRLPEPPANSHPPLWDFWRHDVWTQAQRDNPANFMQWPCVYHCFLHNHWQDAIRWEFAQLPFEWQRLTTATPLTVDRYLHYSLSLIHQAYHLFRFCEASGQDVSQMQTIFEFGAGYGAMALMCYRLGFTGQYYIYDLPEFSLLQQWFLTQELGRDLLPVGIGNITWLDTIIPFTPDLLIACYSLSETDYSQRDNVLETYPADSYLFLYSNRFEQYDNVTYFQDLRLPSVTQWTHQRLEQMPPESWYSFGY